MKKSRPGFLLRVLTAPEQGEQFAQLLLLRSSTLGARWRLEDRFLAGRRVDTVTLEGREIRIKVALLSEGGERPHVEIQWPFPR